MPSDQKGVVMLKVVLEETIALGTSSFSTPATVGVMSFLGQLGGGGGYSVAYRQILGGGWGLADFFALNYFAPKRQKPKIFYDRYNGFYLSPLQ